MNKVHVKKGDTVQVIAGKDKGKKGKVVGVAPKEGKVIVEGVNMVTKHVKPKKQGQPGGILKAEGALYASKVNLYCSHCGKGVRYKTTVSADGAKTRVCAKCGDSI